MRATIRVNIGPFGQTNYPPRPNDVRVSTNAAADDGDFDGGPRVRSRVSPPVTVRVTHPLTPVTVSPVTGEATTTTAPVTPDVTPPGPATNIPTRRPTTTTTLTTTPSSTTAAGEASLTTTGDPRAATVVSFVLGACSSSATTGALGSPSGQGAALGTGQGGVSRPRVPTTTSLGEAETPPGTTGP